MILFDRLVNLITGLGGTAKDKSASNAFAQVLIDDAELESMYRSDWLSRKIIDIPALDMTREWRTWKAEQKAINEIESIEKEFKVQSKVQCAIQRSRLFGGAAIYIGIRGNTNPAIPLNIETVKKGSLEFLHVLNKRDVNPGELERDPLSPFYAQPKWYEFPNSRNVQVRVHPSRIIRFIGAPLPDPLLQNTPWGDPILQVVYDAVQAATSAPQHVASLLPEMKTDIISVPDLSETLSTEAGTARVTARFSAAALIKSLHGVLLLEAPVEGQSPGEVWEQKQLNFSQLPELIREFLQIASGAADIPVTRLLGQSPAGLNSTGESDIRNYYDGISSRQENDLSPNLEQLDEVIIRSALGSKPDEVYYEWAPLWQLTAKEKAELAKTHADTDHIYALDALIPSPVLEKAIRNRLIEDGEYPGIEKAYEDFDNGELEPQDPVSAEVEAANREAAIAMARASAEGANVVEMPQRPRAVAKDALPKPLYIYRPVKNAKAILDWARGQGFKSTIVADDLHVTVVFSRDPVDWFQGYSDGPEVKVDKGGPRALERFGEAIVLLFNSSNLRWRHEEWERLGASWDHEEYQPHITITYEPPDGMDLTKIEPYQGEIILGPEYFEEAEVDWKSKVRENV
jgi:phage-related protein (TIGR01555 family)